MILASIMDNAGKYIQGGLAVLGAAVVGALLAGFFVGFFGRFLFGKAIPPLLLRMTRLLGGAATGFAAGWLVFSGAGGWGLGGGGTGTGNTDAPLTDSNAKQAAPNPATTYRIQMLGGARVKNAAFYLVAGDAQPKTLREVQEQLTQLKSQSIAPKRIELRIFDDSVAEEHPAVAELKSWAGDNGFLVGVELGGISPGGAP